MIERDAHYEMMHGDAFIDELEKIGSVGGTLSSAFKRLSQAGRGRLTGAGIGAGVGAVGGAASDSEDRLGGALRGALLGGAVGTGAGQLATTQGRRQVKTIGQRQLHGMTGYVPRTQAQKARGVGFSGKGLSKSERVNALKNMGIDVGSVGSNKAMDIRNAMERQSITKNLPTNWRKSLAKFDVMSEQAKREAAEKGLTSIPGVMKGMVKNPIGTLRTGGIAQGPLGVALGAVPAAAAFPGAISGEGYGKEYSDKGGIGRLVGENLGYTALGATPLAPLMVGGALAGKAGEIIHRKGGEQLEKFKAGRVRQ